jgi:hypothetical protein
MGLLLRCGLGRGWCAAPARTSAQCVPEARGWKAIKGGGEGGRLEGGGGGWAGEKGGGLTS